MAVISPEYTDSTHFDVDENGVIRLKNSETLLADLTAIVLAVTTEFPDSKE